MAKQRVLVRVQRRGEVITLMPARKIEGWNTLKLPAKTVKKYNRLHAALMDFMPVLAQRVRKARRVQRAA